MKKRYTCFLFTINPILTILLRKTLFKGSGKSNNYYEVAKDKVSNIYSTVANKAEKLADNVQELPNKVEDLMHTKIKQIDDAVESGQKEVKKTLKVHNP